MRAYRVDKNQRNIVDGLRAIGCSVQHLHKVGQGCPDILVGHNGKNVLIEIKHGDGKHTAQQVVWHASWRGQVATVNSLEKAIEVVNAIK